MVIVQIQKVTHQYEQLSQWVSEQLHALQMHSKHHVIHVLPLLRHRETWEDGNNQRKHSWLDTNNGSNARINTFSIKALNPDRSWNHEAFYSCYTTNRFNSCYENGSSLSIAHQDISYPWYFKYGPDTEVRLHSLPSRARPS